MTVFCHFSCDFIVSCVLIFFYCTVFYYYCSLSVTWRSTSYRWLTAFVLHATDVEVAINKEHPAVVRRGMGISSPVLLCQYGHASLLASRSSLKRCLVKNFSRHGRIQATRWDLEFTVFLVPLEAACRHPSRGWCVYDVCLLEWDPVETCLERHMQVLQQSL